MVKTIVKNHIRKMRFERNEMSQQKLADQVGVTRQTVNAIELGKHSPSLEVAFLIADALETSLEAVFYRLGDDDPEKDQPVVVPLKRVKQHRQ